MNDFYTFEDLEPEKQRFLERYFGNYIESDFKSIYETLLNSKVHLVDEPFRLKLITFVMSQFVRTSKLTNTFNNGWNRMLERGFQIMNPSMPDRIIEFEGGGHIDFKDKSLDDVQKEQSNENRKYINLKNMETFYDLAQRRRNDIIIVNRVHKDHFLITSDNPVVSSGFMFEPASHFSMPLNSKHILVLMPFTPEFERNKYMINRNDMFREMSYVQATESNAHQIENAERYIIGKKAHLYAAINDTEEINKSDLKAKAQQVIDKINDMREIITYSDKKQQ